ncbi:MAG: nickel pincer cofactor biosynthesis protein LarC [Geitlerinemataceae cyanobacterium]
MAKLAYLECPTGIAGDMCLGALVDAGVPLDYLMEKLEGLGISQEYRLRAELVQRNSQQATKVYVDLLETNVTHSHHRHLREIEGLITHANLPERVREWSLAIFRVLAKAEGIVHGIAPEKVHFHEVGAIDAIVDIVGTCLGLDWLGIDRLYSSALPVGGGTVRAAHGVLPVPVPAVLKLWESRQVPIYSNGIDRELVTPTGAAIVVALADAFGTPPTMKLHKVGLGAGSADFPIPNILRLWIGEEDPSHLGRRYTQNFTGVRHAHHPSNLESKSSLEEPEKSSKSIAAQPSDTLGNVSSPNSEPHLETVAVLATQIDDCSPQAIGYLFEVLFAVGALDVFTQAVGMKKCRPGILLTVICLPERVDACEAAIFGETTTLGIRRSSQQRSILLRELEAISTPYGEVRVKIASDRAGTLFNVQPEYEDCAQLARQHHLSWQEVRRIALQSWHENSDPLSTRH